MVVVLILWFLHKFLGPYGLDPLVQLIGLAAVGAMVGMPVVGGVRFLRAQNRRNEMRWGRLALFGGFTLLILVALLCVPLPHRVAAPIVLEPANAATVYVDVPGTLVESMRKAGRGRWQAAKAG